MDYAYRTDKAALYKRPMKWRTVALLVATLFASNYSLLVFATVDLSAFRDLMLILLTVAGLLALLMALVWRWEK